MSDEEEVMSEEEVEEEEEAAAPSGPSEAELAMQRRRAKDQISAEGLDDESKEMLAQNKVERDQLQDEISQMRQRSERRKKEREAEEKRMAEQRAAEDARRKAEEEDRKKKKEEEEHERKEMRAEKMAEFEKWKNPPKRNFVITKKESQEVGTEAEETNTTEKKSREQLEAEKQAILSQRIQPLEISGADSAKLTEKAKELQSLVLRLESEKYDLEKRFKDQQFDMMELAERARSMNKVGRGGQIKRLQDEDDKMAERFAGCPSKIVMYSEFERQKDKRDYGSRKELYVGPMYGFPADRVQPTRIVKWDETTGLPLYENMDGVAIPAEEEEE